MQKVFENNKYTKRIENLFEYWVLKNPNQCAIRSPKKHLTYSELNISSNRIANCFAQNGIQEYSTIITLIQSEVRQIEILFSILKSKCKFACLDSSHPSERLLLIIEELNPDAFIFDSAILQHSQIVNYLNRLSCKKFSIDLPITEEQKLILVNPIVINQHHFSSENLKRNQKSEEDIAYIAYTSGSTGKPKGIIQTHRSFCQFLFWQAKIFQIEPDRQIPQWASISYDASYCEIFGALCFGATLCLESSEVRYNPSSLLAWISQERMHLLQVVPSFCRQVLEILQKKEKYLIDENFRHLEFILLSGESLPSDLAGSLKNLLGTRVFNLYGPSECVLATYFEYTDTNSTNAIVPIGKAIEGREILILDKKQQPCNINERGELYIRSNYLTLGYLNQKEETLFRFLQNPLHNDFRDPVFRTGDFGRRRSDGIIEFEGREDRLIKLRGIRIELEEIEAIIRKYEGVIECVVQVYTPLKKQKGKNHRTKKVLTSENQLLIAYITNNKPIDLSILRQSIGKRLPTYMIPHRFILLKEMPLNTNRKLDYNALPNPEKYSFHNDSYIAPQNATQLKLVQIWEKLLNIAPIGIRDNFFDIGGDSLLAVSLWVEISEVFQNSIPFSIFIESPNIEQLAVIIDKHYGLKDWSPLISIRQGGTKSPIFCVHHVGGSIYCYVEMATYIDKKHSIYGLQAYGLEKDQTCMNSIEEMASQYINVIKKYKIQSPYVLIGYSYGGIVAYEIAQQLISSGIEIQALILLDTFCPIINYEEQDIYNDAELLARLFFPKLDISDNTTKDLCEEDLITYVINKIRRCGLAPPDFQLSQALRLLEVKKKNKFILTKYKLKPYSGKITLFVTRETELNVYKYFNEPTFGWSEYAKEGVDIEYVPGTHSTMLQSPNVQILANYLNTYIENDYDKKYY